jgi:hypothetical protein
VKAKSLKALFFGLAVSSLAANAFDQFEPPDPFANAFCYGAPAGYAVELVEDTRSDCFTRTQFNVYLCNGNNGGTYVGTLNYTLPRDCTNFA